MKTKRGTNKFKKKYHGLKRGTYTLVLILVLLALNCAIWGHCIKSHYTIDGLLSPLGKRKIVHKVYASDTVKKFIPPKDPTTKDIIDEIYRVFSKEGDGVAVKAIQCAYSESKLRPYAVNDTNSNGTQDYGIFQINTIHGMKITDAFDYKKNIEVAYQIWKKRKWSAWYGSGCK